MAVHRRWGEKKRVRKSGEGNKRRTTECDSETETERWDGLTGWVFALWATLAIGKPGDSTLCHSTFCQLHGKLFLEDGGFNPSGLGWFFSVCVCKTCITALSYPQCPVEIHHYLPEGTADISLCLSILIIGFVGKKMLHAYICVQQGWGWYLYVEEKEYVACHLLLFSSLLHSDEASNIYGSHTFPRALANMQIHTWWFPLSFFHTVMQADTLRHTLSCTVYKT